MTDYNDMTYEQAEDVLNDTLHVAAQDEMGGHAVYLASIAMEYRTPKKFIYIRGWGACPTCKEELNEIDIEEPKYCPYCGQALDWEEDEE